MELPETLLRFHGFGLNESECLSFTDLTWMDLDQIGRASFWNDRHPGLLVIAYSGRRDELTLFGEWFPGSEPIVLFCDKGDTGFVFAKNFRDAIVRLTIEEFSRAWPGERWMWQRDEAPHFQIAEVRLRNYPDILRPIIGDEAANKLTQIITGRPLVERGNHSTGFLSESESRAAIKELIPFEYLDAELIIDTQSRDYVGLDLPKLPDALP